MSKIGRNAGVAGVQVCHAPCEMVDRHGSGEAPKRDPLRQPQDELVASD
jgi:hypothetical protein